MGDPSFDWTPPRVKSRGQDAVELAALAGLHLDEWQRLALDRILGETDTDQPAAFEAAVIVPRQNGKGSVLEALSLYWLFIERVPLVLHSAHEFKTASEAFRRLRTLLQGCSELWAEVDRVLTGAGSEAIELVGGQRLRYVARSKGSGRGFTAAKVILDEAYALDAEEMAALLPTMATQPAAQVVYTSSAGMVSSTQLRLIRDRGRSGKDPSLAYLEWGGVGSCAEGCLHELEDDACALNDVDLQAGANPRVGLDFIAKERRALPAPEFARERLGWWDDPGLSAPLTLAAWLATADPQSRPEPWPVVLAVDTTKGLRSTAVAAVARRDDGRAHAELLRVASGYSWAAEFLAGKQRATGCPVLLLGGSATAKALLPELAAAGVTVTEVSAGDYPAACTQLVADVTDDRIRHLGDPVLASQVASAAVREVGDTGGWRWSPKNANADIHGLVAVTLARWGLASEPTYDLMASFG